MATSSKNKADKGTIAKAYTTLKVVRERIAKFGESTPSSERATVANTLLDVLPTIREANPDDGKKVRRMLRKLGHFISRDGYDVSFAKAKKSAKRTRTPKPAKSDIERNEADNAAIDADETNANANANANV